MSSALKTLTATVASAVLLSSAAQAAGLGKLTVLSALGQPLRAEIELTAVGNDEADGLMAKLAAPDAFRAANIEFNPALLSLHFTVEQRSGRQVIRISSTQPLNEPFVDMLLELSWNNGRLVREYTFLLDPAELRATQSAQAAPASVPAPAARAASQPSRAATQAEAPAPVAPVPRARPERAARAAGESAPAATRPPAAAAEYQVKRGDTLGRIAAQLKPVDISLDMMLVALYRANPDAFIGNNMNRLKSGQILAVPDSEAIRGSGGGEAHGTVVAHATDFNAYRNKLAGQVATAAPVKDPQATQSVAGKISAKVEERPTAANESQDQLRLSKATPAAGEGKGAAASTEDTIAKEKALADANARVKELEKNVNELEKLMTVKNKAGTEAAQNAKAESTPAVPAAPAAPPGRTPKQAAPPPEPGFADMVMDNINYVGAGAAVLLLGLFGLAQRRKRKGSEPAEAVSILGLPIEPAHSLFAETGGQSVDTNNSVFNSSFAPSASQLDTNEVDPVAEADVYIAYGRDAQAEEILKEALRTHPERYAVRLKLLEIYATRKDQRAFETQAGELYSLSRGQGDEWAQAVALGLSIDPLNPLYTGAAGDAAMTASTSQEREQQALLAQQLEAAFAADEPLSPSGEPEPGVDLAATALPEPLAAAPARKAEDDHILDFDLGGLSFEPVSSSAPIAMPGPAVDAPAAAAAAPALELSTVAAPAVPDLEFSTEPTAAVAPASLPVDEESFDLAFDLGFDTLPAAPAMDARADEQLGIAQLDDGMALSSAASGPVTEFNMAELAREFDLPDLPGAPESSAAAAELKDPLFDLDAMNFDLPATPSVPAVTPADMPADDPFALPDLAAPTPADMATAVPRFDISGIDLDLPPARAGDPAWPRQEVEMVGAEVVEISSAHMEMETKLDLAIAYQEIGDKEGARELLDEVIKGGSSEQVGKANAMRSKLA